MTRGRGDETAGSTHYEILGLRPEATAEEVERAYKRIRKQVHSDVGGSDALFRQIQEAWEVLGDPERKARYDEALKGGSTSDRRSDTGTHRDPRSSHRDKSSAGGPSQDHKKVAPRGTRRTGLRYLLLGILTIGSAAYVFGFCSKDDPGLPRDAFIKQANGICKAGDAAVADAGRNILRDPTTKLDEWVRFYLEHAIANTRNKMAEIGKLNAPAKDRDKVNRMLAAGKQATDSVEAGLKNQGAAYLGASGLDPYREFDATARQLKLTDCLSEALT